MFRFWRRKYVPTFINASSAKTGAATSLSVTLDVQKKARVFVAVALSGLSKTVTSLTDSVGTFYQQIGHAQLDNPNSVLAEFWSGVAPTTQSGVTITVTISYLADMAVAAYQYSGITKFGQVVVVKQGNSTGGQVSLNPLLTPQSIAVAMFAIEIATAAGVVGSPGTNVRVDSGAFSAPSAGVMEAAGTDSSSATNSVIWTPYQSNETDWIGIAVEAFGGPNTNQATPNVRGPDVYGFQQGLPGIEL